MEKEPLCRGEAPRPCKAIVCYVSDPSEPGRLRMGVYTSGYIV